MSVVYILDTECTSTESDREVIELAWLRFEPVSDLAGQSDRIPALVPLKDYSRRFRPTRPTTFGALAVHHILPSEVDNCPPSADAKVPDDCDYLIGHNIDFDWEALERPNVKRICTYAMAQHVWPDADSYSQSALMYMLFGPTESTRTALKDAHSALSDCYFNVAVLLQIVQERIEIDTWSDLWEFSEDCRIPLKMPITKARGELLTDIDDGLLDWCLRQDWLPVDHPYLHRGLIRENERRHGALGRARHG